MNDPEIETPQEDRLSNANPAAEQSHAEILAALEEIRATQLQILRLLQGSDRESPTRP